jgi:hypothetical protein
VHEHDAIITPLIIKRIGGRWEDRREVEVLRGRRVEGQKGGHTSQQGEGKPRKVGVGRLAIFLSNPIKNKYYIIHIFITNMFFFLKHQHNVQSSIKRHHSGRFMRLTKKFNKFSKRNTQVYIPETEF